MVGWKKNCRRKKSALRQFKNCAVHPPGPPPARPPGYAARRPRCRPPAAHPLLPTHSRTVHFQSENAPLIDFSKGNEVPEKVGWKKIARCGNSKIASYILPARRQPGPRGAPPAALAVDPLLPAAHSLLLTLCWLYIRKKSLNTPR